MSESEPFYERFKRVVFGELRLTAEQAAVAMGCSADAVRRLADGRTVQAKFDEALRLCERYNLDPWELALGRPRLTRPEAGAETGSPALSGERLRQIEDHYREILRRLERLDHDDAQADQARRQSARPAKKGA